MKPALMGISIAISAAIAMVSSYIWPDVPLIYYIFKPATTILILLLALSAPNSRYKIAIVIGLLFALMGDIFLMLPSDQFLAGLVCFLITHICYSVAFLSDSKFGRPIWTYLLLATFGVLIFQVLAKHIEPAMKLPVAIYAAALCFMASQAITRNLQHPKKASLIAATGSVLFLISDTILAYDRFVFVYVISQAIILSTYYAAQYLIALSTKVKS